MYAGEHAGNGIHDRAALPAQWRQLAEHLFRPAAGNLMAVLSWRYISPLSLLELD